MADIRIKDFVNESVKAGTSLTNAWMALDKESPDQTEKINLETLFSIDETKIPYIGQNYIFVNAKGDPEENGVALRAAINAANALTPNGAALSVQNRATVYLLTGRYMSISAVAWAPEKFVDIKGIGPKESIIIEASGALPAIAIADDNDNIFENFTLLNSGGGLSFGHNAGQIDYSVMRNLVIGAPTKENTTWNGRYEYLDTVSLVLQGSIGDDAIVDHCNFGAACCGYSTDAEIFVSGNISNSFGLSGCFGSNDFGFDTNITAKIFNCKAGYQSFGYSNSGNVYISESAEIKKCNATYSSFGHSNSGIVENLGIINDCNGDSGANNFGTTGISGKIINCTGKSDGVHLGLIRCCNFEGPLDITANAIVEYSTIKGGKINASIPISARIYQNSLSEDYDANITNTIATALNVIDANL